MRALVPIALILALLAGSVAEARISLLGLTNSLVQFALARISVPGSLEITAETVEESADGLTELVGVRVADRQGVWLEVDGLGVSWNPARILRGELVINRLAARGVRVLRRPEPAAVAISANEPPPPRQPFAWPRAPITTRISALTLSGVEVAAGVLGARALAFDAEGAAADEGAEQSARLSLTRSDAVTGRIALDYRRDFGAGTLRLSLDAAEGSGGVVAELAGFPADSGARLTIDADGPLSDWQVRLDAEAERVFTARGGAAIDLGPPFAFNADLLVTPGDSLPPNVAAVLAPEARLLARAREGSDGVVRIEEGRIAAPELDVTVDGTFARATGQIDGRVLIEARPGLAGLVEGLAFARAGFDGRIAGTLDALEAEGALSLDGLATAPADIARARLEARILRADDRIALDASGLAEGMRLDRIGPALLGQADLAASLSVEAGVVRLDRLSLAAPLLTAEASGLADTVAGTATMAYALGTPDLRAIAEVYGVDASGRAAVQGQIDGALAAPQLTGSVALEDMAYGETALGRVALEHDVVLGDGVRGRVSLRADGPVLGRAELTTDLTLAGDRLSLAGLSGAVLGVVAAGDLAVDLESGLAEGTITARVADLGPATRLAGTPVTGHAAGRLDFGTDGGRQMVGLDISGGDVAAGEVRLDAIEIDARLEDAFRAPAAEGRLAAEGAAGFGLRLGALSFEGRANDLRGSGTAEGRLTARAFDGFGTGIGTATVDLRATGLGDDAAVTLSLAAEAVTAGPAKAASLSGSAEASGLVATPQGSARLRLNAVEAGGAVASVVTAALDVAPRGEARDATLLIETPGIALGGASLGALRVEARAADALGAAPTIDARARLDSAQSGEATLAVATLSVAGPLQALDLKADAAGAVAGEAASLRLRGRADAADPATLSLLLAEAEARLGEAAVRLRRPARVGLRPLLSVEGLDLSVPGGSVRADLGAAEGGLRGSAALALSDIAPMAALTGLPLEAGSLDAQLRLDTRPGREGASGSLTARGLTLPDRPFGGEGAGIDARLAWNGRRARVEGTVSGPFGQPVEANLALPLVADGGGLPAVPPGGGIDGTLRWQGRIGDLWALVPTADHVLDGAVTADLRLSGTLARPQLGGVLSLEAGQYQNLTLGTILTDVSVASTLAADGGFGLTMRAGDGAGGAVTGTANLRGGALSARVDSAGAVLVRRDDATAQVSLALTADGTLAAPRLAGRIGIDRAEVRLVNATPPSVADLGPVRIRGEAPEPPGERAGEAVSLDLAIEAPGGVYVRGRGLDSEWKIDIAVRGTAAAPAVTGRIEKVRGSLSLIGYPFTLQTGLVRFTGGQPIDPLLDIAIVRENNGVTGGIFVTGTALEPDIAFRSTPSLPEDEVLPRVLFGRSQQSLSPAQGLQLAAGLAVLLDGSGGLLDGVRASVGLDVLRIDDEGDGTAVTVGSNVADGVFVGARQPLDGGPAKVRIEIEVFEEVIVDTEIGVEQGSSVGINWRRDF